MRRDLLMGAISSMGLLAILGASSSGIPSAVWSTKGNRGSSPPSDFLGTTDDQALLIQTEGRPAITIGSQNSTEFHRTTVFHQNSSFETNVSIAGSTTTGSLQAAHLTADTFDASNV